MTKDAVKLEIVESAVAGDSPYDADGDGQLSDLEKICQKYDTNRDGSFSMAEVERIVEDMQAAEKKAANIGKLAALIALVFLVVCGALLGLVFAANEASKESHVEGSVMVDLSGNPTQTQGLTSIVTLADLPKLSTKQLDVISFVSFSAYRTYDENNTPMPQQKSVEDFGEFKMRFNVEGYVKSTLAVTLYDSKGSLVVPNAGAPYITRDGSQYQVIVTAPSRRLSAAHGPRPHFYSSLDEMLGHERKHGRHLQDEDSTSYLKVDAAAPVQVGEAEKWVDENGQLWVENGNPNVVKFEMQLTGYRPDAFTVDAQTGVKNAIAQATGVDASKITFETIREVPATLAPTKTPTVTQTALAWREWMGDSTNEQICENRWSNSAGTSHIFVTGYDFDRFNPCDGDGSCDDGGAGSASSKCELGHDCLDCGVRYISAAPTMAPTPPISSYNSPTAPCDTDTHYESQKPTATSGRVCTTLKACSPKPYCLDNTVTTGSQCDVWAGQYESGRNETTGDRICKKVSETTCREGPPVDTDGELGPDVGGVRTWIPNFTNQPEVDCATLAGTFS